MNQEHLDYHRVAAAITFLSDNFKAQPSLEAVAQHVHTSPQHFQRIFTEWAGVSPKKFTDKVCEFFVNFAIYLCSKF